MTGDLHIRRRPRRKNPLRTRRIGTALQASAIGLPVAFPGIAIPEPQAARGVLMGSSLAALVHVGILGALLLIAWLAPPEMVDEILHEVQLLRDQPLPKPDAPPGPPGPEAKPNEPEPAPAPKALAERRSATFAPQAQAVRPQIVNPTVVATTAPVIAAEELEMQAVGAVSAPKEIRRTAVTAEKVSTVRSVAAAEVAAVDVATASAPALRGPIENDAPAGPSVGPRQVAVGTTVGTGTAMTLEFGSSVKEGIASNRDVLGSPDGPRLANVNTRVGQGLNGAGGNGSGGGGGGGGSSIECTQRPEVHRYLDEVHDRTLARWVIPSGVPADQEVTLRFVLDTAGSTSNVALLSSVSPNLGNSAVQALRSASPFPPLPEAARCLAHKPITATFRNPVGG